jgi:hypothetical protein
MLVGVWDGIRGPTWDETYAKLGSGGMNREGVGEAGMFTREYILAFWLLEFWLSSLEEQRGRSLAGRHRRVSLP